MTSSQRPTGRMPGLLPTPGSRGSLVDEPRQPYHPADDEAAPTPASARHRFGGRIVRGVGRLRRLTRRRGGDASSKRRTPNT